MRRFVYVSTACVLLVVGGLLVVRQDALSPSTIPSATTIAQTSRAMPTAASSTSLELVPHAVKFPSGKTITLNAPASYDVSVAAEGLRHVRFMAESPDHRLFVGEMTSASDASTGRVLVFDQVSSTGVLTGAHVYLAEARNPNSVAFYTDATGTTWLYVAMTDKLVRYAYHPDDVAPTSPAQVVAQFPTYARPWSAGGGHITRTVAFDQNQLYISVGSSCNSCEERVDEPQRATIVKMNPDGSDAHVIARGLRNAVGIRVIDGALYATDNGVDHLGPAAPNDTFYRIVSGANYGWPYCYESNGKILEDATQQWTRPFDCTKVPLALDALDPHSAPLGFDVIGSHFLVAEHGSGKKEIGNGYKIVALPRDGGAPQDFVTGFLTKGIVVGRPVDLLKRDASSFFVTDDFNGVIYLFREKTL